MRDASNCCSMACDDVVIRSKVCGVGGNGVVEGVVAGRGTGTERNRDIKGSFLMELKLFLFGSKLSEK